MSRTELDKELGRLREATNELAPNERITDAIVQAATSGSASQSSARDPFAGFARATATLDPGDAFSASVMRRVGATKVAAAPRAQASWLDGVARTGPIAIGLAAVAAAASFFLFLSSEGELDVSAIATVDTVEVLE